jgi:hypothetical protein
MNHDGSDFQAGTPTPRRATRRQRLLNGVHHLRLDRVDISGEMLDEVVLRDPGEALLVDVEVRQRR